jgi:hypothetical protein
MLKLKLTGEPEEIEAFFLHLEEAEGLRVQYRSTISKFAAHNLTGSVIGGIHADVPEGIEAEFTIYQHGSKKRNAEQGFVYLMPAYGSEGLLGYKIGKTTKPHSRRKTFGIKLSFDVKFLALISSSDHTLLETVLHRNYAHKRLGRSEFFGLHEMDVEHIVGLMTEADEKLLKEVNRD